MATEYRSWLSVFYIAGARLGENMRYPTRDKKEIEMPTGRVKFFDEEKGFGFIASDEGDQVYLHASALSDGVSVTAGTRVEFGVAEGRRGAQALSVRVIESPKLARHNRKPADDMAIIVEDLVKLLDGVGEKLKLGQYPERQHSRKVAALLRRVADDFDV